MHDAERSALERSHAVALEAFGANESLPPPPGQKTADELREAIADAERDLERVKKGVMRARAEASAAEAELQRTAASLMPAADKEARRRKRKKKRRRRKTHGSDEQSSSGESDDAAGLVAAALAEALARAASLEAAVAEERDAAKYEKAEYAESKRHSRPFQQWCPATAPTPARRHPRPLKRALTPRPSRPRVRTPPWPLLRGRTSRLLPCRLRRRTSRRRGWPRPCRP